MADCTNSSLLRCLVQSVVRRIPGKSLQPTLTKWGRLSTEQLSSLDFKKPKPVFTENLLAICEESGLPLKYITELEMIYVMEKPDKGTWHAFQLQDARDGAECLELIHFRQQFKSHLTELVKKVSIRIKKHTDEAIWIRIAWGDSFSQPNHLKPTYAVHNLHTPYVFVTGLTSKHKPLLCQALVMATMSSAIKDANLRGHKLTAIRSLLMKQYQQVFSTNYPSLPEEDNPPNPHIEKEQATHAEKRLQNACEAFGSGTLPELQTAVYKLETKFKDPTNNIMTEREEPFKCAVTFTSTNLLESLRHCASSGIASTPVTLLLSSVTQKGRNYFVITDKPLDPHHKHPNQRTDVTDH
ncbi:centromere protein N [Lampris incognitus]|uniref:centromere protein N n=1 Tax=Lampris incognitus TaxID=2546036 RepID=UPI0024B5E709|nr:centromere protein N [Lampris incognitus]